MFEHLGREHDIYLRQWELQEVSTENFYSCFSTLIPRHLLIEFNREVVDPASQYTCAYAPVSQMISSIDLGARPGILSCAVILADRIRRAMAYCGSKSRMIDR